jgi:hypothetical protein
VLAAYYPKAFRELLAEVPWPMRGALAPVNFQPINFLGALRSQNGRRWLVAIAGDQVSLADLPDGIERHVMQPPGFLKPLSSNGWPYYRSTSPLNVYAELRPARRDPNDPGHVSIDFSLFALDPYEFRDRVLRRGSIDGYLQNDGVLRLKLHDPTVMIGIDEEIAKRKDEASLVPMD